MKVVVFEVPVDLHDVLIFERCQRPRLRLEAGDGAVMVGGKDFDRYLAAEIIPATHHHSEGTPAQHLPQLETRQRPRQPFPIDMIHTQTPGGLTLVALV